ncbi:MAG: TlpA family protein disulfide reductase [bacterium]
MKKFLPPVYFVVLAVIIFLSFLLKSNQNEFTAELAMESDAMAIVNYYIPRRIVLEDTLKERNLKLPQFKSPNPKFGALILGNSQDSLVTLVLDESQDYGFSYLYIDKNNNEDLTDDGDPFWDEDKNIYWTKEALVDVHYKNGKKKAAVPYPISFYRYKHRLRDTIVAYRNGYRRGYITLKDSLYKVALLDDDLNGLFNEMNKGSLIIDINRDDILNGNTDSDEYYPLTSPFNINGITYQVKEITPAGDLITLSMADTMLMPKMSIEPGIAAPSFRMMTIDDQVIDLMNFKNKVVLLDFWASWCKPWENELPYLKHIYSRYHHRGFEIIGLNLDDDLDIVKEFIETHRIKWPQISNGRGWEMPLIDIYKVEAIPRNFLLDRNGIIRYKDVRGKKMDLSIRELLNEPLVDEVEF